MMYKKDDFFYFTGIYKLDDNKDYFTNEKLFSTLKK
jgi:hypothetical protein